MSVRRSPPRALGMTRLFAHAATHTPNWQRAGRLASRTHFKKTTIKPWFSVPFLSFRAFLSNSCARAAAAWRQRQRLPPPAGLAQPPRLLDTPLNLCPRKQRRQAPAVTMVPTCATDCSCLPAACMPFITDQTSGLAPPLVSICLVGWGATDVTRTENWVPRPLPAGSAGTRRSMLNHRPSSCSPARSAAPTVSSGAASAPPSCALSCLFTPLLKTDSKSLQTQQQQQQQHWLH